MKNLSISLAVLGVASLAALAAPLASGLKPGENVTPFHPRHLAGPLAGSTNCFPCTFQNRPQVQVWINGDAPQNVATLGKTLSSAMKTYQGKEYKALVVFLSDHGEALGEHVYSHFIEAKRAEWDEYRSQVTDWEVDRYLDQF